MVRPLMIALIGVDGAGKTTQARRLARWLDDQAVPARYFENPGGRPITDGLARILDTRDLVGARGRVTVETTVRAAALLRATLLSRLTGRVAVMDRFSYYQYALVRARGDSGEGACRAALGRFRAPDLVLLLELPVPLAQARVAARGYDIEHPAHLADFASAYDSLPEAASFRRVDADGTQDEVHGRVLDAVRPLLT